MTDTERQHHLDLRETVDATAAAAGVTAALPPDNPLHAGGETRSQWRDVWRQRCMRVSRRSAITAR